MPSDSSLAALSDDLTNGAIVVYLLAALAFAAVFAFRRRSIPVTTPVKERVLAGVGGPPITQATPASEPNADDRTPAPVYTAETFGWYAVGLTVLGWFVQLASLTTRGLAADRAPWATMYEFVCAVVFAAVTGLLVLFSRNRAYYLGAFVMFPAVLGLGLATTTLYTPIAGLEPSLHSYWLAIHVLAAIVASGGFTVATALTALHLYQSKHAAHDGPDESSAAGSPLAALATRLPHAGVLERLARQTVMFAFPIWTFAIIAGAIWADSAWGRYWGWDPKETWAFITWTVYAAYLHAQTTQGWRGRKGAVVSLVAYACLLYNLVGVNLWGAGLHSYAGL